MTHSCKLPRYRFRGAKFTCFVCNAEWVRERYIRWNVWTTIQNGKKVRRA